MNRHHTRYERDDADGDAASAVATELYRSAPAPRPWESLSPVVAIDPADRHVRRRNPLLTIAAVAALALGIAGLVVATRPDVSTRTPATSPERQSTTPDTAPWQPVIERPALTDDIDAIEVSNDVEDWAGRALFPAVTPDGYTIQFVSHDTGGMFASTGRLDTGDVTVQYITATPAGRDVGPTIRIETVPSGVDHGVGRHPPEAASSAAEVEWDIDTYSDAPEDFRADAAISSSDAGAFVSTRGHPTRDEAVATLTALLHSLRLVPIEQIPTEVVDLGDLPIVARTGPEDTEPGVMRAARTTNGWCVATTMPRSRSGGCGSRFDPATMAGVLATVSWDDAGIVEFGGIVADGVAAIEVEFADGQTFTIEPARPDDSDDGVGFWIASRRYEGGTPRDGPGVTGRALAADGTVIGPISPP